MMAAANLSDTNSVTASSANHSPRQNISSPKSRHFSGRTVSSPWSQIVRGELDAIAAAVPSSPSNLAAVVEPVSFSSPSPSAADEPVSESLDSGDGSSTNAGKKPAWNKLSNGSAEVGSVMGAASWPALSESAKTTTTKASSDSLKSLGDGSAGAAWQRTGTPSSSSNKEGNTDVSPSSDSTLNHPMTSRQKSMRRNGSSNSYNSGLPQQSALSSPVIDTTLNNSSKDQTQRTAFASQSHNDHGHGHQQPRNSFRSRGGGSHPRGDSSHHHNHGSRRDHDRGNQDWNSNRNFNAQPHRVVHRFIRPPPPPPNTAAFISPPPMRPIGGPIPFPDFAPPMVYVGPPPPPEALRGVPFVTPIPPNAMFFHAPDTQLYAKIVNQIEYYFSGENLIKDTFLRQNMSEDGWVPIRLIATFNKVLCLTDNIQIILDALQSSTVVEVKGDKVRRRNDYDRWILRTSAQVPNIPSPLSPGSSNQDMLAAGVQGPLSPGSSNQDMLSAGVQGIALENINHRGSEGGQGDVHVEALHNSRPYGNLSVQSQLYGDDGTGQVNIKAGSDHSSSERN